MKRANVHQGNPSVPGLRQGGVVAWLAMLLLALAWSGEAMAAVCTSLSAGSWNSAARWSCGRVPLTTDTVVIAHNITLDANRTVAGLTINVGMVLNDNNRDLTVTGSVINNGTFGSNGGALIMRGASTTISGSGTFNNTELQIDALGISLPVGSTMAFANQAQVRVGRSNTGSFTLNGAVTGAGLASGDRIMRVYQNSSVTINGTINAPNAYIRLEQNTSVTNNGSVTVQYLRTDAVTSIWTQGINSSLTVTQTPAGVWFGVLNASAIGNTVTYNGTATPITPSSNTYFNLAGTGVICPHTFIVLGTNPCVLPPATTSVTRNPSNCVNVAGIGTLAWGTPAFAVSSNNAYATRSLNDLQVSNYLRCTSYGFAIPAGATINGVTVNVERRASANSSIRDAAMRLVKDAAGLPTIQATDLSTLTNYTPVDVIEAHGGAANLWGGVWTAADINSINFGAAFASQKPGIAGGARTVSVDHMPITVTYTPAALDHLVIQSNGSGLTCAANTLTVVACQNAVCTTLYTAGVTGTLSATGAPTVNWDGTTGGAAGAGFVIPNGSSSVTKNVQVATAGSVVFGITSPSPAPANATTCNFGSPSRTFTASLAGFIFSDTTTGNSYTIPAQVSGIATAANALYLRAVQASTTNPAVCTPAIIGQTTAVNMGYACNNPATCQTGNLATINATAIASGGMAVNLTFDANGSTPITARYDDVGRITLNANKTVTPFGGAAAATLNGNSNSFVVAPEHFGFSGITATPIKAGNNFSATVTAYSGLATPTATPNFGKETSPEGVTLSFTKCQPTGTNAVNGAFSGSVGAFASGVASAANLNWSEVGNGDLVATLASGSYLGSGLTATGNTGTGGTVCSAGVGNVGRFIPDHFDTVTSGGMSCPAGLTCPAQFNGFVYSGQPFTTNVYARNAAGAITQNYDGTANTSPNFAKSVTLTVWDALGSTTTQNPPTATPGSLGNSAIAAASFSQGTTALGTPAAPIYTFGTTPTSPTDIYIRAADADATSLRVPANTSVEGGIKVVSGRIKISNAHGSELLQLPIAVSTQYWNAASGWVTGTTDSLTSFVVATPPATSAVNFGNFQKNLTALSVVGSPETVTISGGAGGYTLAAPGANNNGSVDMSIPAVTGVSCFVAPVPLGCYLPTNTARATFGVYKGANEFIYLRENY